MQCCGAQTEAFLNQIYHSLFGDPDTKSKPMQILGLKKLRARKVGINQMKKTVLVKNLLFNLLPSRNYTGSLHKIFNEIPDKSNR